MAQVERQAPVLVLTGGGTGGHITPILAVAHEIKAMNPEAKVIYIGEKGGKFSELTDKHTAIDETYSISAGKLRRYHGESWLRRLFDIKTNLLNLRDFFRFLAGIRQAKKLIKQIQPNVVFQKGGFVGVPISIAAGKRGIPLVTHDSDIVPGLANRMVSRWATVHATALPIENYKYPAAKALQVGVLVEAAFQPVTTEMQQEYKLKLALKPDAPLLLITGGSSGAGAINQAVVRSIATLLRNHATLQVIHQTGKGKSGVYGSFKHERLKVIEFMNPMASYMGAADIVVARASANTVAELGIMGKASIVVPAAHLAGGHQIENAKLLAEKRAALVVEESQLFDPEHGLFAAIISLLIDQKKRFQLGKALQEQTIPDAAKRLATVLLEQAKK